MQLLPHQVIGRDFLVAHPRALLADGMRVGKSVQTIAACDELSREVYPRKLDVLVVCPASIREQWRRQFDHFQKRTLNLTVVSYEEATRKASNIAANQWDLVVFDESHYLKNRRSKRTKAAFEHVIKQAARVWCLTGTPSPNNASELWPMLRALFPETIINERTGKPMDYWAFTKRFCVVKSTPFGEKIEGNRNIDELKRRMAPIMLRRPSTILGNVRLPDETLYLDASAVELKRLIADLKVELGEHYRVAPEDMQDFVRVRAGRLTGLAKVPALVSRLKDEFESGLDKAVLFAWHTDVINALYDALRDEYGACVVHGGVSNRQYWVDLFQQDAECRVFIGQIKAAGEGLDLTAANELIFVEKSWVPGQNDQAANRILGINQKRAARVRYAVLPGSFDERLMSVNERKAEDNRRLFG